jgi:hypothetical protein
MEPPLINEKWLQRLSIACRITLAVGILNFIIFAAIATYLGNGKAQEGHFYLFGVRTKSGSKVYTEVSERVFNYSKWHVYCTFASWPLVMAAAFGENRLRKRSKRE